jgi:hypothetical protein
MSKQRELHDYIARVRRALQLRVGLLGGLILFAAALVYTVIAVLVLNHYAFPHGGVIQARSYLIAVLVAAIGLAFALPLVRLTSDRAVREAEALHPQLEERLTTFQERESSGDPFIELLAADTLTKTADAPPSTLAPAPILAAFAGAGVLCLGLLLWMIFAGPGYMGYGASLLWTGEKKSEAPLYALTVAPGNVAVRRKSDQLITASLTNLHPDKVQIFAQFAHTGGWEPVAMQPIRSATGNAAYQFMFTGLPEDVEYYVTAGPLTSPHYKVRVVDLPFVKSVKVTYHYPKWTGLKAQADEHGGDLRAIEGTEAQLEVEMDRPLADGNLTLDDGKVVHLTPGANNKYTGTIAMVKDGAYHVAATSEGQPVRLSEDYFIATDKAEPPQIAIDHPGQDYRASPIEEVTIGVKGGAQFGLRDMHLHYSVNGGPDKDINLLKQPGATTADGKYTLPLEDFKLSPGDVVSLYATAKDGHAETKTDISFIQADPFEREFSQSQQGGGGGGGGGGGQGNQTEISKREKELIAQTWKQINEKNPTEKAARAQGDFLSGAQSKLRDQVMALSARINSRDLSDANEEFSGFEKDMQEAAKNMLPASEKLNQIKWQDALQSEQKALQALLRAEATFRQIQVAFGQQGGGGGGGGSSTGRDLASLFDLELDTEKNQYETARSSSPQEEHAKEVEDALAKLDALAKRQEEIANQQKDPAQAFQQRWQQEMLRREAEQLQRQMEQLAKDKGQQGQSGQQGQQGQRGQQGQQSQSGQSGQGGQSSGQQSASSSSGSSGGQSSSQQGQQQASSRNQQGKQGGQQSSDQRIEQALSRMKAANDAMKRSGSAQGSTESAKEAAQRLREATGLLGGAQQDIAGNRMSGLSREADRIQQEQRAQTNRIEKFAQDTQSRSFDPDTLQAKMRERNQLAADRQELSNSLSKLQKDMRTAAQGMAGAQPDAAKKLRDALSEMDQSDLDNHMQRTADWLRSGINPNSNGTEKGIADGLGKLSQELHAVQSSLGNGKPGQRDAAGKGEQTAALGQVERLRSQLQAMQAERNGTDRQGNAQQRGNGTQPGQGNSQQARNGGQQGQGQQQGQQGQGRQGSGQQGQGQQAGNQQGGAQSGGRQQGSGQGGGALSRGNDIGGGDVRPGDIAGRVGGGYRDGTAWGNINTGNNTYAGSPAQAKGTADNPADTERTFNQSMRELQALRGMVKDDPQAAKEIADLQKQMQGLDPKRFPGNPALVEQMHGEVLRAVDKLELRLQRSADITDARIGKPDPAPAGYSDAAADYYRRLSKGR